MGTRKAKNIQIQVDHAKLSEAVMPQLLEMMKARLPDAETYQKAIAELGSQNANLQQTNVGLNGLVVALQQKNDVMALELDKYHKSIDDAFEDHENRLLKLEGKPIPETAPVEAVPETPAPVVEP